MSLEGFGKIGILFAKPGGEGERGVRRSALACVLLMLGSDVALSIIDSRLVSAIVAAVGLMLFLCLPWPKPALVPTPATRSMVCFSVVGFFLICHAVGRWVVAPTVHQVLGMELIEARLLVDGFVFCGNLILLLWYAVPERHL